MNYAIPLYHSCVKAGFPSPADDFIEQYLDLNEFLINCKNSTFFIRVSGSSMINAGIFQDDILIVDRSLKPKKHDVVLAILDNEFTVKRFIKQSGQIILKSENPKYRSIYLQPDAKFEIWGVVTRVIHKP